MPPPEQRRAFPDKAHEDLAQWVEEAIAEQSTSRADIDDSFLLAETLFELVDQTAADVATGGTERGHLQDRVTDLEGQVVDLADRLAALEQAHEVLPGPDAAG